MPLSCRDEDAHSRRGRGQPGTLSDVKDFGDWLDKDPTGDSNFVFISVLVIAGVIGSLALVVGVLDEFFSQFS